MPRILTLTPIEERRAPAGYFVGVPASFGVSALSLTGQDIFYKTIEEAEGAMKEILNTYPEYRDRATIFVSVYNAVPV